MIGHITTAALQARGWTPTAIKRWLGPPDHVEEFRIYGRGWCSRYWYTEERVLAAEATSEWQSFTAGRAGRSERAKKAAATRYQETIAWAETVEIRVYVGSRTWEQLCQEGVAHKRALDSERGRRGEVYEPDDATRTRWALNYARHELSNYEAILADVRGRTGSADAYEEIKQRVMDRIDDAIFGAVVADEKGAA